MKIKIFILVLFFLAGNSPYVQALEPERIKEIKNDLNVYRKAVRLKHQWRAKRAFERIYEDEEAMAYIKENHPGYYRSLKLFKLSLKAQQAAYDIDAPELPDGIELPSGTSTSSPGLDSNRQRTFRYSNQNKPSNQSIVDGAPNQSAPDNRSIVEGDRNQDRLDNKTLIEIRKRARPN